VSHMLKALSAYRKSTETAVSSLKACTADNNKGLWATPVWWL